MHHPHRNRIYHSWSHVIVTVLFVLLPFVILLSFSRFAHIAAGSLFKDIGISSLRLLIAYLIAIVLAWLGAVCFYQGKRAAVALPLFDVLQSFPTFAALPLATMFWGASNTTVILFLVITVIWPIFFALISSLKLSKKDWQEAVTISRLNGFDYIVKFLLPITIPGLITGSIVGLGEGWEALVATEIIVGAKQGLGTFFQSVASSPFLTSFGILGLLACIFTINKIVLLPLLEWSHHLTEE